MAVDLKQDTMVTLKYGAGDTVFQYLWYKFIGPKVISYFGAAGKYADVVATALYSIALNAIADEFGSEFADYLRQGGASTLGRALSNALGDPRLMGTAAAVGKSMSGTPVSVSPFATLSPVKLVG
jgi:hypothetical protein